jgi:hypothetical protein
MPRGCGAGRIDLGCRLRFRYGHPAARALCPQVYALIHPPRLLPLVGRVEEGVFGTVRTPGLPCRSMRSRFPHRGRRRLRSAASAIHPRGAVRSAQIPVVARRCCERVKSTRSRHSRWVRAKQGMRKEREFVDGLANVPKATLSAHSCSVRARQAFANCGHWLAQWQSAGNRFEAVILPYLAKISG